MKVKILSIAILFLIPSFVNAAQYAVKYNNITEKNEIYSVSDTGTATLKQAFAFDSGSWSPTESYTDAMTGVIYLLDSSDATYVTYDPATNTLTKNVINGYVAGYQKLFPNIEPVEDIIENTTDSWSVAASKIKTLNLTASDGTTLIKKTTDGATHIGQNSLVTIEQNGKQSLYATDANGNKIDIDINNGSNLLINGVNVIDKINGSVAMGAAISSLPKSSGDATSRCGLGSGYYDKSIAISFGCAVDMKSTQRLPSFLKKASLNFGSTIGYNNNNGFSQLALGGGISWPIGKEVNNNTYSNEQGSRIESLNNEVSILQAQIAEINAKLSEAN
jgi:hypothetical protein